MQCFFNPYAYWLTFRLLSSPLLFSFVVFSLFSFLFSSHSFLSGFTAVQAATNLCRVTCDVDFETVGCYKDTVYWQNSMILAKLQIPDSVKVTGSLTLSSQDILLVFCGWEERGDADSSTSFSIIRRELKLWYQWHSDQPRWSTILNFVLQKTTTN